MRRWRRHERPGPGAPLLRSAAAAGRSPWRARLQLAARVLLPIAATALLLAALGDMEEIDTLDRAALLAGQAPAWLNVLPFLLLFAGLALLLRRAVLACLLTLAPAFLLHAANAAKMQHLVEPVVRADFQLLLSRGAETVLWNYVPWGPRLGVAALAAGVVLFVLARWEPPALPRGRVTAALGAVVLAAFLTLAAGWAPWSGLYAAAGEYRPWDPAKKSIARFGLTGNLVQQGLHASRAVSLGADPDAAAQLLQAHAPALRAWLAQPAPAPLPDIVIVQSESYFDPARVTGYAAADWIPELRRLQRRALHGDLDVPTYGGGTIRTEFEVLTGIPLRYFPALRYPYLGLPAGERVPGLAQVLRDAGYGTLAIHPYEGGFWNRREVFRRMGFERFIDQMDAAFLEAPRRGTWISDAAMTDVILDMLPAQGPPQFIFAISMEAHGAYRDPPLTDAERKERDAMPAPPGFRGADADELRNFLLRQRDADAELGRLARALLRRERPALLLFYGDHLPGMTNGWPSGFKDGLEANEQPVPWLLLDTRTAQGARDPAPLPTWLLGARVLERAGVRTEAWFGLETLLADRLRALEAQPGEPLDRAFAALATERMHDRVPARPPDGG